MYKIKTRNWNQKKIIAKILNTLTVKAGGDYNQEKDNDNKYYLETKSKLRAWTLWALFMALSPLSGGWTYIIKPGHSMQNKDFKYKSIY